MNALFTAKENKLTGRTEYRSRRTGIVYSIGPDTSEYSSLSFSALAPNLSILSSDKRQLFSVIEIADANTG